MRVENMLVRVGAYGGRPTQIDMGKVRWHQNPSNLSRIPLVNAGFSDLEISK